MSLAVKLLWEGLVWQVGLKGNHSPFFVFKLVFHWSNSQWGHTAPVCGGVRKVVGVCEQGWREEQDDSSWEQPTDQSSHHTKPSQVGLCSSSSCLWLDGTTASQEGLGWKGPQRSSRSNPILLWFLSPYAVKSSEGQFPGGCQPPDLVTKKQPEKRWERGKWDLYLLKLWQSYANSAFYSRRCQNWGIQLPRHLEKFPGKVSAAIPIPSVQAATQTAAGNYKKLNEKKKKGNYPNRFIMWWLGRKTGRDTEGKDCFSERDFLEKKNKAPTQKQMQDRTKKTPLTCQKTRLISTHHWKG